MALGEDLGELVDLFAHGGEVLGEQAGCREGVSHDGIDGDVEDRIRRDLQVPGVQFRDVGSADLLAVQSGGTGLGGGEGFFACPGRLACHGVPPLLFSVILAGAGISWGGSWLSAAGVLNHYMAVGRVGSGHGQVGVGGRGPGARASGGGSGWAVGRGDECPEGAIVGVRVAVTWPGTRATAGWGRAGGRLLGGVV